VSAQSNAQGGDAAGFDVSVQPNVELVETQSNAQLPHFGSSLSDFDERGSRRLTLWEA
jgi:hypothetical protein